MHGAREFLEALTTVLCVAAVMTVVFQRLRQPAVLGYVLAGVVVGPYVPIPLVADREIVQTLSELGVILLMFSLGLEFSLRKLARVGPTASLTALVECSVMLWLGYAVGGALGWTVRERLFAAGMIAISSTTIIAKAFEEQHVHGRLRELVLGVLIVEDLIAVLLLTLLPVASANEALSLTEVAKTSGRLTGLLALLVAAGVVVVPRAMRAVLRQGRAETTLIASVGICFAFALLARSLGYSVALGAFLAGSLVAESGEAGRVEALVRPVRDLFAAIFFVSVGMLLDPRLIAQHWPAVLALSAAVIAGKIVGVSVGAFLTGNGTSASLEAGMSLAQIGEFSFIIAGLGVSLGATGEFLFPVAVAVSILTTLTTPAMIRASPGFAAYVDRKLPRRVQTFAALYGSWVERLGNAPRAQTFGATVRRLLGLLALDASLLGALAIGAAAFGGAFARWLESQLGVARALAGALVLAGALALAAPLVFGVLRIARRIGTTLARAALPDAGAGAMDLSIAPRRALVVALQLLVVLGVGLPLLALTQPFVPVAPSALVLALALGVLAIGFWRSAEDLQGHVRAGAMAIIEALAAQPRRGEPAPDSRTLAPIRELLPGLGEPEAIRIAERSPAVGKTLSQLDLRGLTGATVLAITRGERSVIVPPASEVLAPGDVLALAGTHEAVAAALALLQGRTDDTGSSS